MFQLSRVVIGAVGAVALTLTVSAPARAQIHGVHSGAVDFAPVDAAALGDTLQASVGLFGASDRLTAAAGAGVRGGAVRGYVGGLLGDSETSWSVGAGYARTLASRDVAGPLHGTFGAELVGGFLHAEGAPQNAGAVRLTLPVGLTLGDPSGWSLGVYAAPYAESALDRQWHTTSGCNFVCYNLSGVALHSALGVGTGLRLSLGRLAAELIIRDMLAPDLRYERAGEGELGFTYRIGR